MQIGKFYWRKSWPVVPGWCPLTLHALQRGFESGTEFWKAHFIPLPKSCCLQRLESDNIRQDFIMEAFLPGLMRVAYSCEDNFLWNRQKKPQIILLVLLSSVLQATSHGKLNQVQWFFLKSMFFKKEKGKDAPSVTMTTAFLSVKNLYFTLIEK